MTLEMETICHYLWSLISAHDTNAGIWEEGLGRELGGRVKLKDEAIHMGREPAMHCPCLANTPSA